MDETNSAEIDAGNDDLASRLEANRTRAMVEEIIKCSTGQHRYQPEATPVSRARRVLGWFRKH